MGLDNIPVRYACQSAGTAVMVERKDNDGNTIFNESSGLPEVRIDCKATIDLGKCPYQLAMSKAGIEGGGVTGIFGTPCWYRGKYGNFLLDQLDIYSDGVTSFYGYEGDGTYKPPSECVDLSDSMEEAFAERGGVLVHDGEDISQDVKYAIWWLKWVADECGGTHCWY